jgi:dihydrofolate reductase
MTFRVSAPTTDHLKGLVAEVGAMLTGRRTFERANGWGGQHPCDVPAFVVTHNVPDGWPRSGSTVQFVTDGIESAVARAKSAADPKSVGVHGAQTIQQCLDAGVLDEIHIDFRCCGFVDLLRGRHEWGEMTRRGLEQPAEAPPPERQARA